MSEEKFVKSKVIKIERLNEEIIELFLEKPSGFDFIPGQFIQLYFEKDLEKHVRSYSLCSSPKNQDLRLCVKVIPGGKGSSYISSLKIGDAVEVSSPKGHFSSLNYSGKKYFIATGVGIAPILSMLESECDKQASLDELRLVFGLRSEKDVFWENELDSLKKKCTRFNHLLTLSQPSDVWSGERGRVTSHLSVDLNAHYFICGSMPMVRDVRKILLASGLNTKSIHIEIF